MFLNRDYCKRFLLICQGILELVDLMRLLCLLLQPLIKYIDFLLSLLPARPFHLCLIFGHRLRYLVCLAGLREGMFLSRRLALLFLLFHLLFWNFEPFWTSTFSSSI